MRLTGAQIGDVLEQAIENVSVEDSTKKVGGMIQISGLRFTYYLKRSRGSRVLDVTVGGRSIRRDRRYGVSTNALMGEGGHNYRAFTEGAARRQVEGTDQFAMVRRVDRAAWNDCCASAQRHHEGLERPTTMIEPDGRRTPVENSYE